MLGYAVRHGLNANYNSARSPAHGFPSSPSRPRESGFTLVEVLVVLAIIGLLLSIAAPAVMRVRGSAKNTECKNNLRQFGLALQNHQGQFGHLPVDGENGWGFGTFLLPQLDQKPLFDRLMPATAKRAGSTADEDATGIALKVFLCPSFASEPRLNSGFGRSNYLGTRSLFGKKYDLGKVHDGESNTIAVGDTVNDHAWALPGTGTCGSVNGGGSYGSQHGGGANFVMCDGSVRFLSDSTDSATLSALCTPAGNDAVGSF